jgi:hypothetical protein
MIEQQLDYDVNDAQTFQITNDAYHWLAFKEPCLDDENYEEAEEIKEMFPYGFKFDSKVEFVENSDLVEVIIIPIQLISNEFTHYKIDGKWWKYEFYYSKDKTKAYYRIYDMYNGRFMDYGWNDVIINKYGKPEIQPCKGCIFPLWGKNWKRY